MRSFATHDIASRIPSSTRDVIVRHMDRAAHRKIIAVTRSGRQQEVAAPYTAIGAYTTGTARPQVVRIFDQLVDASKMRDGTYTIAQFRAMIMAVSQEPMGAQA